MPLTAVVDGKIIIGPDLTRGQWQDLSLRHRKGLAVTMRCCGAAGHLRVSKNGTQHFFHAVDTGCTYAEESREHLEIKHLIYRTCRSEGWNAAVEFRSHDRSWIADVCAERDGRKVVFEIQISPISPEELEERDNKYRRDGIESYWLLEDFLGRHRHFRSWYDACLSGPHDPPGKPVPYLDPALFATGPENHLFIAKGIRSAGLKAKEQILFTTGNPAIPLAVWVREVLKGNYQKHLGERSAEFHARRRQKNLAAPAFLRFRKWYTMHVRDRTCKKTLDQYQRIRAADDAARSSRAVQKKIDELAAEIDWVDKECRSIIAESYGLFTWKKIPGQDTPRLTFRLETDRNIRKFQECVSMLDRWESSFFSALENLEREFPAARRK